LRQVFADYQPLALVEAGLVIDKSDEEGGSASAMTVSGPRDVPDSQYEGSGHWFWRSYYGAG
jgi:hypothetical protein